ncbi:Cell cycle checkpoint protein rad17, partial [Ascosphaera atra]
EEFPGFLGQASVGLNAFRGSLYKYLAQATRLADASALAGCPPIVMVVSEALLGSARGPFDAFTAHRLLGAELAGHPGIGFVDFNPVAPTFMAKALQLVLRKEARQSGRKRVPSPAVLKQFYELGDIRSAISAVEFLCRGDKGVESGGSLSTGRTRKSSTREPPETAKTTSLQMVTQREASLGLFHATGKVIHNKRDNPKDLPPNSEHEAAVKQGCPDPDPRDLTIETEGVDAKYIFRMHLSLRSAHSRSTNVAKNTRLVWRSFWSYNQLTDDWAEFGLRNDRPFVFSRVRGWGME